MTTLKKGSKGNEVKTLQRLLGVAVDGDFGAKTEDAVKAFQRSHGLVADGIVGEKTWKALGRVDNATDGTNPLCVDPSVIYMPITRCITKSEGRPIKYLAIHYTAGSNSYAGCTRAVRSVFQNGKASADFAVDDRDMAQYNPDIRNYYCWAVGDKKKLGATLYGIATNKNTISIEICSSLKSGYDHRIANHEGWYLTDKALDNAAKLAKMLMKKFNIPLERVVRHYDVSGKICPGVIGWNNATIYTKDGKPTKEKNNSNAWLAFKERLK